MAGKKLSLEGLLTQAVADRHSPLYIAMREHHDAMVRAFENKRPDWSALVVGFNELGILDGDGKRPTAEATRQAWYRARNMAVSSAQPALPASASAGSPATAPSPAAVEQAAPSVPGSVEAEPPRRTFGVATPRGLDPAAKAAPLGSANAEPPTPAATVDVDEVLARFSGKPSATRR